MLPLHGEPRRLKGQDVHHTNETAQRGHVEDGHADR